MPSASCAEALYGHSGMVGNLAKSHDTGLLTNLCGRRCAFLFNLSAMTLKY
jgi:hypothetical protein